MCHETRAMSQVTHNCLLLLVMEVFPQELHVPQTVRKHLTHIWVILSDHTTRNQIKFDRMLTDNMTPLLSLSTTTGAATNVAI